ncbi:MAG: glycosyltransferase, partial [Pseudomonadota bacterium]
AETRSGRPALIFQDKNRRVSFHSRVDPEKEAEGLVSHVLVKQDNIIVVLGLGLGYHLRALLKRLPEAACLVVIEAEAGILRAALKYMDLSGLLAHPGLHLLAGLTPEETLKRVTALRLKSAWRDIIVWGHPPSLRARPEFYGPLRRDLEIAAGSVLRRHLFYPRLAHDRLKVMILDAGYYLVREMSAALRKLGHQGRRFRVPDRETGSTKDLSRLISEIADFKPDFVLTVNHLGFDQRGILADFLTGIKMPFASWFVDSPWLILGQSEKNRSEYCSLFIWDSDYLEDIKVMGYAKVHYLPLGTDEDVFKPANGRPNPLAELASKISFVGDSMQRPVQDKIYKLGLKPVHMPMIDLAARNFMKTPEHRPDLNNPRGLLSESSRPPSRNKDRLLDLEGLITWRATQLYRLELLKNLAPLKPTVVGDQAWRRLLPEPAFRFHPALGYYDQLPRFYAVSSINLNATSMQMKTGLNQRVFDVPACGAFLLTDYRRQIEGGFEVGREVICYRETEEALDLAGYYDRHERERINIALRGRDRVLAEHTYVHRLNRLVEQVRKDHLT